MTEAPPAGEGVRAERPRARGPAGLWLPLLRVGGIGVYLDPLVLALLAGLFLLGSDTSPLGERILLLGIALGSVFLHELGHALMARRRGLAVGGIYLHLVPFAYVERGTPADELRVALAGPATNVVLAALLYALPAVHAGFPWLDLGRWATDPLWAAFGINLLMGGLNLVPALPADGGRALRAGLMLVMAPATAYARTARVGTFVGAGTLLLAVWLWPSVDALAVALLGVFFVMVAWRETRAGQVERRRERMRHGR